MFAMTTVTILGCGSSSGVPIITGSWGKCDPGNPKNRRTRTSALIESNGKRILIDTSPDLRCQLLRENITDIDAVLLTHAHFDHIAGINDLRPFCFKSDRRIPIYSNKETIEYICAHYEYIFQQSEDEEIYKPFLDAIVLSEHMEICGMQIHSFDQCHGVTTSVNKSMGFRFDKFAYCTDVVHMDEKAFAAIDGVEVFIIDCVCTNPKPTHAHLEKTLLWIEKANPKRAILTHMGSSMDYNSLCRILPDGTEPAYDGMRILIKD